MWTGILAFLQALPKIVSLMDRLGQLMQEKRFNEWMDSLDQTLSKLEVAQTVEEKRAAARGLVDVVRRLK